MQFCWYNWIVSTVRLHCVCKWVPNIAAHLKNWKLVHSVKKSVRQNGNNRFLNKLLPHEHNASFSSCHLNFWWLFGAPFFFMHHRHNWSYTFEWECSVGNSYANDAHFHCNLNQIIFKSHKNMWKMANIIVLMWHGYYCWTLHSSNNHFYVTYGTLNDKPKVWIEWSALNKVSEHFYVKNVWNNKIFCSEHLSIHRLRWQRKKNDTHIFMRQVYEQFLY